ncbi:MAG: DUF1109 family protein [Acidobacteria bacterium]|nr:DUF1109 family protein [Acidobacteriota bacterium]
MHDCESIAQFLERAGAAERAAPPEPIRAHLEQCPHCRELWRFMADAEPAALTPQAEERITQTLLGSLQAVRPLPSRTMIALAFMAVFLAVSALTVALVGWSSAQAMTTLQLLGMLAAILVSAGLTGFWLSGEMAPGEKRWTGPGGLCAGSLAALGTLILVLFPWEAPPGWLAISIKCFRAGFVLSLPAVAPLVWLLRRGFPLSWGAVGAGAGLLAGMVGFLMLHMECRFYSAPHIVLGHLTAPLAAAGVGYALGKVIEAYQRSRAAEA